MAEEKVDPVASAVATAAAEVLQHHKTHDVVDLDAVMAGKATPPGPPPAPPQAPSPHASSTSG